MTGDWLAMIPAMVTGIAVLRIGWVCMGFVRTFSNRGRRVHFQLSLAEAVTMPEPFVLALVVVRNGVFGWADGAGGALLGVGFAASLLGLVVSLAAFASFPTVGSGHYVDAGQRVVRSGIYGWVRHPIYLGAILIWIGLALGCRSVAAGVITLVYVIPAYLTYIRAEDKMMCVHFGEEYRRYRAEVGTLWPHPAHPRGWGGARPPGGTR
jgi:protein-S-isoprenylcysteine O-methyltransferase Ste14